MSKRAAPGAGSTYFDAAKGLYIAQRRRNGRTYRAYGKTKTEARKKLDAQMSAQTATRDRRSTVAQALDTWLARDVAGRDLAPSTVTVHRWAADLVRAEIGTIRLARLTVADVEDMLDRLAARDASRSSLKKVRGSLALALDAAMRREQVTRNVARLAQMPAQVRPRADRRSLTPDEARTLLAALREEPNGLLFALMLRLGLRPGEAIALHWDALDLDTATLTVRRGVQVRGGRFVVTDEVKTASSRRTIGLPGDLCDALRRHRSEQATIRLSPLVFPTSEGTAIDPANLRRQLGKVCDRLGIPRIVPHELRHSAASLLIDSGAPIERVADLLGHRGTRVLDDTYRHRVRPVEAIAVESDWSTG